MLNNRKFRRRAEAQSRKSNPLIMQRKGFRPALLGAAAASAMLVGDPHTAHAQVGPGDPLCVVEGATVICSGDLSTGVAVDGTPASTIDTLIIDLVTAPGITPVGDQDGVSFTNNAGGNIIVNSTANISTQGATFSSGIAASIFNDAGDISITSTGEINTAGDNSDGIVALIESAPTGTIEIDNAGTIDTAGVSARGIDVLSLTELGADITITNTGDITTLEGGENYALGSRGISAVLSGGGAIDITNDGDLETSGQFSRAINAYTTGGTTAPITIENNGSIATSGNDAEGIQVFNYASGTAAITNTASLSTNGSEASAIQVNQGVFSTSTTSPSAGDGDVVINNSGDISTAGAFSRGIDTRLITSGAATTTIVNTGDITTTGGGDQYFLGARAISINTYGTGDISIDNSGALTTSGQFSRGIHAFAADGLADINVTNSGLIATIGDDAEAIQLFSYSSGVTTLENDATLSTTGARASAVQVIQDSFSNSNGSFSASGDGDVVINNSGDISTAGTFSRGIDTRLFNPGTATTTIVNTGDITTTGGGDQYFLGARAISANTYGSGDISIDNSGALTTSGQFSRGIHAYTAAIGTANIDVVNSGIITTSGDDAEGIQLFGNSTGSTSLNNSGNISTSGDRSAAIVNAVGEFVNLAGETISPPANDGLFISNSGNLSTTGANSNGIASIAGVSGDVTITNSGNITTEGVSSSGIGINHFVGDGNASVTSTGTISTIGDDSSGVNAVQTGGLGDVSIASTGDITAQGNNASAINGFIGYDGSGNVDLTSTGILNTTGNDSDGIAVRNDSSAGTIDISNDGNITTTGLNAAAIYGVQSGGTGNVTINSTGNLSTASDRAAGINGYQAFGIGDVTITSTGDISTNGSRFFDSTINALGYEDSDGIVAVQNGGDGNVTITSTGDITTAGVNADGLVSVQFAGDGNASVTSTGTISTSGDDSPGVNAVQVGGIGNATIVSTGDIATQGNNASAVNGYIVLNGSGNIDLTSTGDLSTTGENSYGIVGRNVSSAGTIDISNEGDITTAGSDAAAIYGLQSGGAGNVTITSDGDITTAIDRSSGIAGYRANGATGEGDITITSTGDISTQGTRSADTDINLGYQDSDGIVAINNAGDGAVTITSTGDITTSGVNADGLVSVQFAGDGNASVTSTGTISTSGDDSPGVNAVQVGGVGDATIVSNGDITTAGTNASAVSGFISGDGSGNIDLTSTGILSTTGDNSYGIAGRNYSSAGTIDISNTGNITTGGSGVATIYGLQSGGAGNVTITSTGGLTSTGVDADGIRASTTSGAVTVGLLGGIVSGGTGAGAGVNFTSDAGVTSTLNTNATSTISSLGGTAVLGADGNDTVNNAGTVTGNVQLGGGTNAFNNNADGVFNAGSVVDLGGGILTNAGILSPGGNGVNETSTITGDLILNANSILEIDVLTDLAADQLIVTGAVNINNATLQLNIEQSTDDEITIINNDGVDDVAGAGFANVIDNFAFLDPELNLAGGDGNDVVVTFVVDPNVAVEDDGQITVTNDDPDSSEDLEFNSTAEEIVSDSDGVDADNNGTGDLEVTTANVTGGTDGDGINATNSATGGGLTITTAADSTVAGGDDGIEADNQGTGDLMIDTAAGTVEGGDDGIDADNNGTGALAITTADVTGGTGGDGINATSGGDSTGGLTITTTEGDVTGGSSGIVAANDGAGATTIMTGGVTGTDGDGINATNSAAGGGLTIITAADSIVQGGDDGIVADNQGGGALSITTGNVTGTNGDGIRASSSVGSVSVTVTGSIAGGATGAGVNFTSDAGITSTLNIDGISEVSGASAVLGGEGNEIINNTGTFNISDSVIDLGGGENAFNNSGTFNVSAIVDLGDNSTFTNQGEVDVSDGQIVTAGTLTQETGIFINNGTFNGVTVINGGTLAGSGIFNGNVTAGGGGAIAPGNSIGIVDIDGDLTLNEDSTLEIEVSSSDGVSTGAFADLLIVEGAVNINDATLQLDDFGPVLESFDGEIVIIDNDGADAVAGSFATVVDNLAFLTAEVTLTGGTGNDVALNLTTDAVDFSVVAVTPNQLATGTGLNSVDPSDPGIQPLLAAFQPLTFEQAQAGLNSLSGEVHASAQFALNSNGLFVGDSVTNLLDGLGLTDRAPAGTQSAASSHAIQALALAPGETAERLFGADLVLNEDDEVAEPNKNYFVFGRGLFRDVQIDADGNGGETDIQNRGFIAGGGFNFDNRFQAGLSVGYLNSEVEVDALNSDVDADSAIINAFARFTDGPFDGSATFGYIYSEVDSERGIAVGALTSTASAEYDTNTFFGSAELGYTKLVDQFAFRPFVSGGFSVTDQDGFTETGAGAANLTVASQTSTIGQFSVGASASTSFLIKSALIVPRIEVAYDRLIGDVTPGSTAQFQPGGAAFTVVGATPSRSRGRVNAGVATKFSENITGFLDYQGVFSSNDTEHGVRTGLRLKF